MIGNRLRSAYGIGGILAQHRSPEADATRLLVPSSRRSVAATQQRHPTAWQTIEALHPYYSSALAKPLHMVCSSTVRTFAKQLQTLRPKEFNFSNCFH